jgi:hypothetical protein
MMTLAQATEDAEEQEKVGIRTLEGLAHLLLCYARHDRHECLKWHLGGQPTD